MSEAGWADVRAAFEDAADVAVRTVHAAAAVADWDAPGLGEWDVRALVGHTSRSFLTIEQYLGAPGPVVLPTAADYLLAAVDRTGGPEIAQRGRDAGAALGIAPATEFEAIARRVRAVVAAADPGDLVASPFGAMTLAGYLPTRTLELTVHTCDLATAAGLEVDVPVTAAAATAGLLGAVAARRGLAVPLLLAATGRRGLPDGFSAFG